MKYTGWTVGGFLQPSVALTLIEWQYKKAQLNIFVVFSQAETTEVLWTSESGHGIFFIPWWAIFNLYTSRAPIVGGKERFGKKGELDGHEDGPIII